MQAGVRRSAVAVAFLFGLAMLIERWPPDYRVATGFAALSVGLVSVAATMRLGAHEQRALQVATAVAIVVVLSGGLVQAVGGLLDGGRAPFAWVLIAAATATLLLMVVAHGVQQPARSVRYAGLMAYCTTMSYLVARLQDGEVARLSAGPSVSAADIAFDVLVFTFIQARFNEMSKNDKRAVAAEYVNKDREPITSLRGDDDGEADSDTDIMVEGTLLGLAVAIGVIALLVEAAGPLQLNAQTSEPDAVRWILVAAVAALVLILIVNDLVLRGWRRRCGEPPLRGDPPAMSNLDEPVPTTIARTGRPKPPATVKDEQRELPAESRFEELHLPGAYWLAPAAAAAIWLSAVIALSAGPLHLPLLAGGVALVMFVLYWNSLWQNTIGLQTLRATRLQNVLCIGVGAAMALATFWFVSVGIWQGTRPLGAGWLAGTALVFSCGQILVFVIAGRALATGLPAGLRETQFFLSRQAVDKYIPYDALILGMVFLITVTVPLYAVSRDQALDAPSLNVVASMVFLPGLISGVLWGLRNWQVYGDDMKKGRDEGGVPEVLWRREGSFELARPVDGDRLNVLQRHLLRQRRLVLALMMTGLSYLAYDLIT